MRKFGDALKGDGKLVIEKYGSNEALVFKLRKKDEFKNFTEVIGNVDIELSNKIKRIKKLVENIKLDLNNKETLNNDIKNLENVIGEFKILDE